VVVAKAERAWLGGTVAAAKAVVVQVVAAGWKVVTTAVAEVVAARAGAV
jgi:hypothetical protein